MKFVRIKDDMKKYYLIWLTIPLLIACHQNTKNNVMDDKDITVPTLERIWSSDTVFATPESVIYDAKKDIIYVSNVNKDPWAFDGDGFISKMDLSGKIIKLKWIEGLDGPKGLGLHGNSLFVADIDKVVEIDIESDSIVNRTVIEGNPYLNDLDIDKNGIIYTSDSRTNKVFMIDQGKISILANGNENMPNGILVDEGNLLLLSSTTQTLSKIDLQSKTETILVEGLEHGDGITAIGNGSFITTNWFGELHFISSNWENTLMIDTKDDKVHAADLYYIKEKKLLLVPTFFDNRVMAYKLID